MISFYHLTLVVLAAVAISEIVMWCIVWFVQRFCPSPYNRYFLVDTQDLDEEIDMVDVSVQL